MTSNKEYVIIQALLSLFGKVDLQTPKDVQIIKELHKMLKEIEE